MINDRRSGAQKQYEQEDLLSILISTEFYNQQDNLIIDEILTFFFAGMKTIVVSTTNLVYYMTQNPEIKAKILNEVLPPLEKVSENLVQKLSYDTVMEFEYF